MMKPKSIGKKRIEAPVEPIGVRGESAHRKNCEDDWETRSSSRRVRQVPPGINNWTGMLGWESDEPVVAMKRGSARGAKGL